jgi:hypothetical protein
MSSRFNTKEFKSLKSKWYKKLAKSGFEDIEGNEEYFNASDTFTRHSSRYRDSVQRFEAKQEYYRLAGHFLYDHKFSSTLEKMIWQLHSEGLSIREITKKLQDRNVATHKNKVHETLQQLKTIMVAKCNQR